MDFYAKMKELQISQQDKSRLRATQLQAMWKRICDDEQKSLNRNEELMREFERVEGHMKRLSARTERLQKARQEYMNYITEHYPQWIASKRAVKDPSVHHVEPSNVTRDVEPTKQFQMPMASSYHSPSFTQDNRETVSKLNQNGRMPVVEPASELPEVATSAALAASIPDIIIVPEIDRDEPNDVDVEAVQQEIVMRSEVAPVPDQDLEVEDEEDIPLPVDTMPKDILESATPRLSDRPSGLNSPTIRRLAVRDGTGEVLIPMLQLGSTDGTGVTVGTGTLSDQNMSELLGSVQSSSIKTPRIQQESPMSTLEIAGDEKLPEDAAVELETDEVEPEIVEAALSLDGMCFLLQVVAEDFAVSFNPESFYRCAPPDRTTRKRLVYNANSGDSLNDFDPETMSMVILEELPLVCRELPGNCMVRDDVLTDISFMVKEIVFRAKLTTDGRQLWDSLYDHMRQAVAHGVLSPREMALMIGPSLLKSRSKNQEKIVTVLTSLVQSPDDSQMSDVSSSQATSVAASPTKPAATKPNTPAKPAVSVTSTAATAVSPRDKSTSDDDLYDNSTPRYQPDFRLTGSAAYQTMMNSGRIQAQAVDDDDDDVEDMLAINNSGTGGTTPPVVVPTNHNASTESLTTPGDDRDLSAISAPSPVTTTDKMADVSRTEGGVEVSAAVKTNQESQVLKSSAGSQGLKSSGSSQALRSSGSQAPKVLQRVMSDEFSDTEISLPMAGTTGNKEDKSEIDDFDGFFD